ncbi:snaclec A10 [Lingula anatina]|uniref:Snaclec A10 n=1 Tax=Lingula anatina TaxID=7574 RepID=A0A1S3I9N1_LINAN|nr:snaclec A10 [Lingula anatina]|eukprot:XP_013394566.1 snaclec A10 [Lingula anatina]
MLEKDGCHDVYASQLGKSPILGRSLGLDFEIILAESTLKFLKAEYLRCMQALALKMSTQRTLTSEKRASVTSPQTVTTTTSTTSTTTATTKLTTTASPTCPSGFEQFQQSCYLMNGTAPVTWTEAKAFCKSKGAFLAEIGSTAEQIFVSDFAKRKKDRNSDAAWLGGRYDKANRFYVWDSTGQRVVDPTFWNTQQSRDFLFFYTKMDYPKSWYSCEDRCGNRVRALCEKDLM